MKRFYSHLIFIIPLVFACLLWESISRSGVVNPSLFPPFSKVVVALWEMVVSGMLLSDLGESVWRLCAGLVIGSMLGILIGLIAGRSRMFASVVNPLIQALRPLPPVALIPLVIVWFGIDDGAKIFSIAFAVFFPVWLSAYLGVQQIPQTFLWSAHLFRISKLKMLWKVVFPASLPFIISGIRTAIAIAFVMVFVSELSGASAGLGYRISISSLSYRIDQMMAALVVLGALGAITDHLFAYASKKIFPWLTLSLK
jgi:NitT/TauT family transport system permease protein